MADSFLKHHVLYMRNPTSVTRLGDQRNMISPDIILLATYTHNQVSNRLFNVYVHDFIQQCDRMQPSD